MSANQAPPEACQVLGWKPDPEVRYRILGPESEPSLGDNLNGPSPIRVPDWIPNPLGKFYLYFGHHRGQFIRMAYADHPEGPWKVYSPGVLKLEEAPQLWAHIASPDVIIDEEHRRLRMYFHGGGGETWWQESAMALSTDGLHFDVVPGIVGPFYMRVFPWKDQWLAIALDGGGKSPILLSNLDGMGRFRWMRPILSLGRHVGLWIQGDVLWVFYSRFGDEPERILASRVEMHGKPEDWDFPEGTDVLRSELPWEGVDFPIKPSRPGPARDVHQLRDPGLLEHEGKLYLYYSGAGESCLGMTKLIPVLAAQ